MKLAIAIAITTTLVVAANIADTGLRQRKRSSSSQTFTPRGLWTTIYVNKNAIDSEWSLLETPIIDSILRIHLIFQINWLKILWVIRRFTLSIGSWKRVIAWHCQPFKSREKPNKFGRWCLASSLPCPVLSDPIDSNWRNMGLLRWPQLPL